MSDPLTVLRAEERQLLREEALPRWKPPMLATLTEDRFSRPDWIFERKFDGVRCLAFVEDGSVHLFSRNRKAQDETYPELVDALAAQARCDMVVDGEIVAFDGRVTSFSRLQERMQVRDASQARRSPVRVFFYLFDILHCRGLDVTRLPLRRRKALLRAAVAWEDPLRFTIHRNEAGEEAHAEACRKGWEGIIAKDANARYSPKRSQSWLKFKCVRQQEFVIGGYTDPKGSRSGFGALLLGYYDDDALRYAGMVGTGFNEAMLQRLSQRLERCERRRPPFDGGSLPRNDVHWVEPRLVGEVGFTEWTRDGRLRHPRFLGLRDDKNPTDVVREEG